VNKWKLCCFCTTTNFSLCCFCTTLCASVSVCVWYDSCSIVGVYASRSQLCVLVKVHKQSTSALQTSPKQSELIATHSVKGMCHVRRVQCRYTNVTVWFWCYRLLMAMKTPSGKCCVSEEVWQHPSARRISTPPSLTQPRLP